MLVCFAGYSTPNFGGIYKYEPPYTQKIINDEEKIKWWIYSSEHVTTTDMTLYHSNSKYIERADLYNFFMLCQEWSIITPGTEPYEYNDLFVSMNEAETIIHGYSRIVKRTGYYELQGLDYGLNFYRGNTYIKSTASFEQGLSEMRVFTYNLQTREFTVNNWTSDMTIGSYNYMLFTDRYILGEVYSCGPNDTYYKTHWTWDFNYLKDDATTYNDLLYSKTTNDVYYVPVTITTYNKIIDGYDASELTADSSQVTYGHKFIGANRTRNRYNASINVSLSI